MAMTTNACVLRARTGFIGSQYGRIAGCVDGRRQDRDELKVADY